MNSKHEENDSIFKEHSMWIEDMEISAKELKLFTVLLTETAIEKSKSRYVSYDSLFGTIENLSVINHQLNDVLIKSVGKIEGIKECDDLQCENHFVNEHNEIKLHIESYFSELRSLKRAVFNELISSK